MKPIATQPTTSRQIRRTIVYGAALGLALVLALALRVPRLSDRPMHVDEAVQATKAGQLFDTGEYHYNPYEFHGPTLYYVTLPFIRLSGAESFADTREATFRAVPLVFGIGLILMLLLLTDGMGRPAVAVAALMTALSPAMAFFSRYYIQEMLFVFFTFGSIVSLWRFAHYRSAAWAARAGAFLGLMYATKETCVIAYAALAIAGGLTWLWTHGSARESDDDAVSETLTGLNQPFRRLFTTYSWGDAMLVVSFLAITLFFYSSAFTHWAGVLDSVKAFTNYLHRADGSGSTGLHDHPWTFYFGLLLWHHDAPGPVWSEGLIFVLALAGVAAAFMGRVGQSTSLRLARFLALYTILMTLFYSLIPYKTPWSMLSFLHGWILMAGIGAAAIYDRLPGRVLRGVAIVLLAAGLIQLGVQARRTCFRFASDQRNPYVYAHSTRDVLRLAERLNTLASLSPDGRSMLIRFITDDYWPMPWYLRRFDHVGYWHAVPEDVDAPVVITSPELEAAVQARMKDQYQVEYYGLRHEVLMTVFIREDLWKRFIDQVASKRKPASAGRKTGKAGRP